MIRLQRTLKVAAAGATLLLLATAGQAQSPARMDVHDAMMKAADTNADGMVSRQEFQDQMGTMWDQHHAMMLKGDPTMKQGMMERGQFRRFSGTWMKDPGQIGGN